MALLRSTTRLLRRLDDPSRPLLPVLLMVAVSFGAFAWVWMGLEPTAAEGRDRVAVAPAPAAVSSELLVGPGQVVLPLPTGDGPAEGVARLRPRSADVALDASLVNGEGLSVALADAEDGVVRVSVVSERLHRCGAYAATLVVDASAPDVPSDRLVLPVRFAACGDHVVVPAAPDSVNDTEPSWGEDGRAPWRTVAPVAPTEQPTEVPTETEAPAEPEPTRRPAPEPTRDEPATDPSPTRTPSPEPTGTTEPTPEPTTAEPTETTEPTAEPTTEPTSEPTTDPSPSPSPTTDPSPSPSPTTDPSPSPSPTAPDDGAATPGPSPSP